MSASVRVSFGITDVDNVFMRQEHPQFCDDSQSADTGIKHTDRPELPSMNGSFDVCICLFGSIHGL